jgi:hypothetical protein
VARGGIVGPRAECQRVRAGNCRNRRQIAAGSEDPAYICRMSNASMCSCRTGLRTQRIMSVRRGRCAVAGRAFAPTDNACQTGLAGSCRPGLQTRRTDGLMGCRRARGLPCNALDAGLSPRSAGPSGPACLQTRTVATMPRARRGIVMTVLSPVMSATAPQRPSADSRGRRGPSRSRSCAA